jgi:Holliday junction resolvasome RuvABC DNA-binding subunit
MTAYTIIFLIVVILFCFRRMLHMARELNELRAKQSDAIVSARFNLIAEIEDRNDTKRIDEDVVWALINLGYNPRDARTAVCKTRQIHPDAGVDLMISKSLSYRTRRFDA